MNPNRKKIQCPYCEETYKHEQNYRDHISSKHTGVKSHICKVCGAAFIHQNQLMRHKQAQHKDLKQMFNKCNFLHSICSEKKRSYNKSVNFMTT